MRIRHASRELPIEWWPSDAPTPAHLSAPWISEARAGVELYLTNVLTSKHPLRNGPVCPYIPAALRYRQVFFVVGSSNNNESREASRVSEIARSIWTPEGRGHRRFRYAAVVILYEPGTSAEYVEEVQYRSKSRTVANHVMVGALHAANNAESVHGGGFYPLRTPSPTIVLRDMVPSDLQFLTQTRFSPRKRLEFYQNYLSAFEFSSLEWERRELAEARRGVRDCERRIRERRVLSASVGCIGALGLAVIAARVRAQ
jgi:hypothetical protein